MTWLPSVLKCWSIISYVWRLKHCPLLQSNHEKTKGHGPVIQRLWEESYFLNFLENKTFVSIPSFHLLVVTAEPWLNFRMNPSPWRKILSSCWFLHTFSPFALFEFHRAKASLQRQILSSRWIDAMQLILAFLQPFFSKWFTGQRLVRQVHSNVPYIYKASWEYGRGQKALWTGPCYFSSVLWSRSLQH